MRPLNLGNKTPLWLTTVVVIASLLHSQAAQGQFWRKRLVNRLWPKENISTVDPTVGSDEYVRPQLQARQLSQQLQAWHLRRLADSLMAQPAAYGLCVCQQAEAAACQATATVGPGCLYISSACCLDTLHLSINLYSNEQRQLGAVGDYDQDGQTDALVLHDFVTSMGNLHIMALAWFSHGPQGWQLRKVFEPVLHPQFIGLPQRGAWQHCTTLCSISTVSARRFAATLACGARGDRRIEAYYDVATGRFLLDNVVEEED